MPVEPLISEDGLGRCTTSALLQRPDQSLEGLLKKTCRLVVAVHRHDHVSNQTVDLVVPELRPDTAEQHGPFDVTTAACPPSVPEHIDVFLQENEHSAPDWRCL